MSHTPGPWHLDFMRNIWASDTKVADTGHEPNQAPNYREKSESEIEANRVLMCAAPELLEALVDLIGWVPGANSWHTDGPVNAVERARVAIAKARGES